MIQTKRTSKGALFCFPFNHHIFTNNLFVLERVVFLRQDKQQLTLNNYEKCTKNGGIDAVCRSYDDSMQF